MNTTKRCLVILDEYLPIKGAPSVRIHNFLSVLKDYYSAEVIGGTSTTAIENEPYTLTLLPRPSEKSPLRFLYFLFSLARQVRRSVKQTRYDLIVLSVPKYEMLFLAPFLSRNTHRFILDIRDSLEFLDYGAYLSHFLPRIVAQPLGKFLQNMISGIQRKAVISAHKITVANIGIKERLSKEPALVTVISNGVDTTLFNPSIRKHSTGERLNLMYLGNFAEKDRFDLLLPILPPLAEKIELHLIGEGRNREKVHRLLEGTGAKTTFYGAIEHSGLPQLLANMDFGFIFRSEGVNESIPVALYEFSGMGIPSLCNDIGLMSSFVQEHQLGKIVRTPEELSETINKFYANPELFNQFSHIRSVAEREFSLAASALKFRSLITGGL